MAITNILGFLGGILRPPAIVPIPDESKTFLEESGGVLILAILMIVVLIVVFKTKDK